MPASVRACSVPCRAAGHVLAREVSLGAALQSRLSTRAGSFADDGWSVPSGALVISLADSQRIWKSARRGTPALHLGPLGYASDTGRALVWYPSFSIVRTHESLSIAMARIENRPVASVTAERRLSGTGQESVTFVDLFCSIPRSLT